MGIEKDKKREEKFFGEKREASCRDGEEKEKRKQRGELNKQTRGNRDKKNQTKQRRQRKSRREERKTTETNTVAPPLSSPPVAIFLPLL